eukprot:5443806-Prymnesium_polylepis.1
MLTGKIVPPAPKLMLLRRAAAGARTPLVLSGFPETDTERSALEAVLGPVGCAVQLVDTTAAQQ